MSTLKLFRSFGFFVGFLSAVLSTVSTARAYVFTRSSSGAPLRWPSPYTPTFYVNWLNNYWGDWDGLTAAQVFSSFTKPLQRWKATKSANIDFRYYQGENNPQSMECDAVSVIFFTSYADVSQILPDGVIGLTGVCSDSTTGQIIGADLKFNDEYFDFTTTPTDSTQFTGNTVFLENVATHEFGHAFGLAHSAALHSSMVFIEDRGQAKPSCDDIQGIGAAYPLGSFQAGRGSITGQVRTATATAIFGAHVQAVSKTRGTVIAGALTRSDGTFTIPDLEPGDYYLFAEPFQGESPLDGGAVDDPLCGGSQANCYYANINAQSICSGAPFKRFFAEVSPGAPRRVQVGSGTATAVGALTASCSALSHTIAGTNLLGTAPVILEGVGNGVASAALRGVHGAAGTSHYYRVNNVSGKIAVKVVSYGLYSPMNASVELLDAGGAPVAATVANDVFTNASGFINYDPVATFNNAPLGTYYIKVTNFEDRDSSIEDPIWVYPARYPAGYIPGRIDAVKYYLVMVTANDSTAVSSVMANNARCEASADPTPYPDLGPGVLPSRAPAAAPPAPEEKSSGLFGCGVLHHMKGGGGSGGGFSGPDAVANFVSAWGVLILLALAWMTRRLSPAMLARRPFDR